MTRSSREFAPRRFAPCTDAEAASPHASRPGTCETLRRGYVVLLRHTLPADTHLPFDLAKTSKRFDS